MVNCFSSTVYLWQNFTCKYLSTSIIPLHCIHKLVHSPYIHIVSTNQFKASRSLERNSKCNIMIVLKFNAFLYLILSTDSYLPTTTSCRSLPASLPRRFVCWVPSSLSYIGFERGCVFHYCLASGFEYHFVIHRPAPVVYPGPCRILCLPGRHNPSLKGLALCLWLFGRRVCMRNI